MSGAARKIIQRIEALAGISDEPGQITRTCASPAMQRANELVAKWMRATGMKTRVDAIGNLIGHYPAAASGAKILLLGSHLDTVRNAGKFDGPLGVILAIACVENLRQKQVRLPFAVEVIAFADEEGVRYQSACLGSKVLAGSFDERDLERKDASGISLRDAIINFGGDPSGIKSARLNPKDLLGYLEAHIEQGPVLEKKNLAVGVVTAIAGQTRARVTFIGRAGHAGTTPMNLRQDALCAAAEFILAVEKIAKQTRGLVATVGKISALPGAGNVIPGEVQHILDLRHAKDSVRKSSHTALKKMAFALAARRKIQLDGEVVHDAPAVNCSKEFSSLLGEAVLRRQKKLFKLPSGAGHDAGVMAEITPAAMLFIRCRHGLSHHPAESVKVQDVQIALDVMNSFLQSLAEKYEQRGDKVFAKPPQNLAQSAP
jgi:allantoate deiminase